MGLPGVLSRPLSVDPSPFQSASSRAFSMSNIRLHLKIKKNRPICPQSVPFCVTVFPRMCLYWVSLTALSQCLAPAVLVNPCPQPKSCATFSFMKDGETRPCGGETPCPRPEAKSPHPGSKRLLSVASSDPPRAGRGYASFDESRGRGKAMIWNNFAGHWVMGTSEDWLRSSCVWWQAHSLCSFWSLCPHGCRPESPSCELPTCEPAFLS